MPPNRITPINKGKGQRRTCREIESLRQLYPLTPILKLKSNKIQRSPCSTEAACTARRRKIYEKRPEHKETDTPVMTRMEMMTPKTKTVDTRMTSRGFQFRADRVP